MYTVFQIQLSFVYLVRTLTAPYSLVESRWSYRLYYIHLRVTSLLFIVPFLPSILESVSAFLFFTKKKHNCNLISGVVFFFQRGNAYLSLFNRR
jgi:hypothetical protein